MTPATHAAVAAVAATRCRSLTAALGVSFVLHFATDFIYHFEAFYPLSVLGPWTYGGTMLGLFGILAALGAPLVVWIARRDRQVGWFALFGFVFSFVPFDPDPARRFGWALLVAGLWIAASRTAEVRRWILCGLAGYLPDLARHFLSPLKRLHEIAHYDPLLDLGDWVSLLVRGRWRLPLNDRIFDPCYQVGYALNILLEGSILFGCLWWLTRRRSVTDLPAVNDQADAVHKGSLVG